MKQKQRKYMKIVKHYMALFTATNCRDMKSKNVFHSFLNFSVAPRLSFSSSHILWQCKSYMIRG